MAAPQEEKSRLLIVEDDSDIRELLKHFLKEFVDEIVEAEDGSAALQFVKAQEFDTILSDIEMPHMNGLKFLAYVRSLGQMTPFVVLTAHGDHSRALEALSLGAFDFITKDSKRKVVIESVCAALKFGREMKSSKNDAVRSSHLRKIYADMSKSSEMRLRKIIEEMSS
ncbi:response regulator [Bdellovibrio bacteriovorus]|uniref:Two-component response regulator n=3 Tax=Bdellovibrio bacteriovorus TaxID=959 RepID=Q6MR02_BDEBA|nr:response regulator [Bdellovibrio bacteriovorus]AFY00004.1 two-component response regulator [Bdellovibrio bacteriovorus str. Tiberius]AHZ85931.1 two-component response regulator [Bdellovibrio bacteriovorus]ASD65111.1 response regulator [Bdellovibrio bacteriovorus]CAE77956.1 two-component response regulator [Bdellovibrio bacteriovorus HD100]BEV66853.1 putative transcriptional regulatory protein NarL [Bdellovibrio bacteriovorus]